MDSTAAQQVEAFARSMLTANGVGAGVGIILSIVAAYFPEYEAASPRFKRFFFLGACVVLPFIGVGILCLVLGRPFTFVDAVFPALAAGLAAIAGGTAVHGRTLPNAKMMAAQRMAAAQSKCCDKDCCK